MGEDCPYICEEFITPNGISVEEILGNAQADKTKEAGFLSSISEDLKVKFSKTAEFTPESIATTLDTTVESTQEILLTEVEKKLLDQEPVKMMIDEISEGTEEETVEEEEEVEPEAENMVEEAEEAFEQELYQEKSASSWNFVASWAILLFVIIC